MTNEICDFLVIGGGIAGASCACMLSNHGKTIIAERESAPDYHTTGRSAAKLSVAYENVIVSLLIAASVPFFKTAHETGFSQEPLLSSRGMILVGAEHQFSDLDDFYEQFSPVVKSLQRLDRKQTLSLPTARILNPDRIAGSVVEPDATDIDVHALHQAYFKNMKANGGKMLLNAEVISMQRKNNIWLVETKAGTIEAKTIINAAGAWADEIARLAGSRPLGIQPMRRTVITFGGVPDDIDLDQIMFTRDVDNSYYFRAEGRGQILGSPVDETPSIPCDAQPEEIDIAKAAENIERAIIFPIKKINHKWAGLRNFAPDRIPVVGFDSHIENFFWMAGQGGAGIKISPTLARIAEGIIINNKVPKDIAAFDISRETLSPERFKQ